VDETAPRSRKRGTLRDRPLGRILILAVVLGAAVLAARSCADNNPDISQERAVAIALSVATFVPDDHQVRFLRRGIPSQGVWVVSLYQGDPRQPTRVQLVVIDSETGEIVDDNA